MKYVGLNFGDWATKCSHLSLIETAVYFRLLCRYYVTEAALPADHVELCRITGARRKSDRQAVDAVMAEFFELTEDGYRQSRADEEIEAYRVRQDDADAVKAGEHRRMQRYRDNRARLFREIKRATGLPLSCRTPQAELYELAKHHGIALVDDVAATPVSSVAMRSETTCATDVEHFCNASATAKPLTENQQPTLSLSTSGGSSESTGRGLKSVLTEGVARKAVLQPITEAGRICALMRQHGVNDANPGDKALHMLIATGTTDEQFIKAAQQSDGKNHPFAWALTVIKNAKPAPSAVATTAEKEPNANVAAGLAETQRVIADMATVKAMQQTPSNRAAREAAIARVRGAAA